MSLQAVLFFLSFSGEMKDIVHEAVGSFESSLFSFDRTMFPIGDVLSHELFLRGCRF